MKFRISGLPAEHFAPLFALSDAELSKRGAERRVADDRDPGYPCRISLEDAAPGEELILLNHVSHDVAGPFRTAYAIYVREGAAAAPAYTDETLGYLDRRTLSLRGFGADGMLRSARLALPGESDAAIREMFGDGEIATIHAHNAAYGCFLARIERN